MKGALMAQSKQCRQEGGRDIARALQDGKDDRKISELVKRLNKAFERERLPARQDVDSTDA
jgi:hypothetical protein